MVWGFGYRASHDHITESDVIDFDPDSRTCNLFSAFVQDRISLIPERLYLIMGSKFEHNDYSGFELQPGARLLWKPRNGRTFWLAVSRAVRTPSRANRDINLKLFAFTSGPTVNTLTMKGNNDFDPEEVVAYEAGYRLTSIDHFSLDITAFYNVYHDLKATETGAPQPAYTVFPPPPARVIPLEIKNRFHENTWGMEISGNFEPTAWWKLSLGYSRLNIHLFADSSEEYPQELDEGSSPKNQFSARSYLDLPYHLQLDAALFYVDDLPGLDVPAYTRLDMRIGWQPAENLELSLKLENLTDNRHPEYIETGLTEVEVPRSIYGKITWRF